MVTELEVLKNKPLKGPIPAAMALADVSTETETNTKVCATGAWLGFEKLNGITYIL